MKHTSAAGYLFVCFAALLLGLAACSNSGTAQKSYPTPDEAAQALIHAAETDDTTALLVVFGPDGKEIVNSGDAVQDKHQRAAFVAKAKSSMKLEADPKNSARVFLLIGKDGYSFPVPLVQANNRWRFDTKEGKREILARRIGSNELDAIAACDEYVKAQYEYSALDHSGAGVPEYAKKLISSPGKQDGLYWLASADSPASPISSRMKQIKTEGYEKKGDGPVPYHGYYFRILKGQGDDAAGGARDYIVQNLMIGGFGLIASPAEYGSSGITTFIVNQDGVVYGKDLGPNTATAAREIVTFNPDKSWNPQMWER